MTISPLEIYFISLVDKIDAISETVIFISFLAAGAFLFFWILGKAENCKTEEDEKILKNYYDV